MNLFSIFSILISLSAFAFTLNSKTIRLPNGIFMLWTGLFLSLVLIILGLISPEFTQEVKKSISGIDFSEFLLGVLLSFLLFAGSIHIRFSELKPIWRSILTFSTLGTLISTFLMGILLYYLGSLFHFTVSLPLALLFGALISPTDPIAVIGILRKAGIPKSTELKITGEALFNDGMAVVVFTSILGFAGSPGLDFRWTGFLIHFLWEAVGGLAMGWALGYLGFKIMHKMEDYSALVFISLSMVMGGYTLCHYLGFSGPLAMVVCGIYTGSQRRSARVIDKFKIFDGFWEVVDEVLNAILFMLLGLELVVIRIPLISLPMGLILAILLLLVRHLTLWLISYTFRLRKNQEPGVIGLMTWGGLRGGLSVAMALSIPRPLNHDILIPITYIIVLFSILVQGLSMEKVVKYLNKKNI